MPGQARARTGKQLTSLSSFLVEAHRLQHEGSRSSVSFMRFLFLGEKHPQLWQEYKSFAQVLEASNLCPTRRYLDFKAAHAKLTPKQIEMFGVEGAIEVTKVQNPEDLKSAVRAVQAWTMDNGALPNRQRVSSILRKTLSHLRRTSYIRRHDWQKRAPRATWCSCCGTITRKDPAGIVFYTKPGWEEAADVPPCIRVRNRLTVPKAVAA